MAPVGEMCSTPIRGGAAPKAEPKPAPLEPPLDPGWPGGLTGAPISACIRRRRQAARTGSSRGSVTSTRIRCRSIRSGSYPVTDNSGKTANAAPSSAARSIQST